MIKDGNYVNIQAFMTRDLQLKGNSLIVYAIIYGFCQAKGHVYNGSIAYLQEWTNATRQGIIRILQDLVDRGYIVKEKSYPTNTYYIPDDQVYIATEDKVTNCYTDSNKSLQEPVTKSYTDSNKMLQNNINNNIVNNIDNKYTEQLEFSNKVEDVISYFNSICKTKFKSNTAGTRKLIKARLQEGFTVEDMKKVIDLKYFDWGVKPVKFSTGQWSNEYLRPSTLFGNKFESYLYEAEARECSETHFTSVSAPLDKDESDLTF